MFDFLLALKDRYFPAPTPKPTKTNLCVGDVFFACSKNSGFVLEMAAVCLAVENHYGHNDFGFDLYGKLQSFKLGKDVCSQESEKLKQLIALWENDKAEKNGGVYINNDMTLQDGIHRLALAVYHGIENITVHYTGCEAQPCTDRDILAANVFSAAELSALKEKSAQLAQQLNKTFACIIWSPAFPFYKDILKDFESYGTVSGVQKLSYGKKAFKDTVHRIYAVDNIARWKINTKLKYFTKYQNSFIVFNLSLAQPDFYLNTNTNSVVSRCCGDAKKAVRKKHKDRIKDYIYDIILHTCDNFYQSQYMLDIFSENPDRTDLEM